MSYFTPRLWRSLTPEEPQMRLPDFKAGIRSFLEGPYLVTVTRLIPSTLLELVICKHIVKKNIVKHIYPITNVLAILLHYLVYVTFYTSLKYKKNTTKVLTLDISAHLLISETINIRYTVMIGIF